MEREFYIGEFAKEVGRHPNSIRQYIKKGFIDEPKRDWAGRRLFTSKHIQQIKKIKLKNNAPDNSAYRKEDILKNLDNVLTSFHLQVKKAIIQNFSKNPGRVKHD